ncbi:hypothetical protein [Chania multitudinisentens]|uniref:hypothetical protein n=1 Tax=Chania multitudinisentens TaxID=1639108 RepID=UPI001F46F73D|nr:hypothetical protein [Chania multitudinisentens]
MGEEKDVKEGIKRPLTFGETVLSRGVFGNSINYGSVFVHCDSYLPFGLQDNSIGLMIKDY